MSSTEEKRATEVVDQMFNNDPYSQWLGIKRIKDGPGISILQLTVREEMLNGHGTLHGGISYSISDSALAFASNSHGKRAVSIETDIAHIQACFVGDVLTATAKEVSCSNKIGRYEVLVTNQDNKLVARFNGTVYRTSKEW